MTVKNTLPSESGLSLIEVLVAAAVGIIVLLSVTTMTTNFMQQKKELDSRYDKLDLENGARTQLLNAKTCECNFKGKQYKDDVAGLKKGVSLTEMKFFDMNCANSMPLVKVGDRIGEKGSSQKAQSIAINKGFKQQENIDIFQFEVVLDAQETLSLRPMTIPYVNVMTKTLPSGMKEIVSCGTGAMDLANGINENGNKLEDLDGDQIQFSNITAVKVGNVKIENRDRNSVTVRLFNNNTGRKAYAQVDVDPATGKFTGVKQAAGYHPYLCHNPSLSVGVCDMSTGEPNCSSPIYYYRNSKVAGSVNNLTMPSDSVSCGNVYPPSVVATFLRY